MVRARLFSRTGELAGASFEIGEAATVGRLPDNQVVLPGDLISGHHGRISFDARQGCYVVEDLGSRNGTFVAGLRVREPEKLGRLEVINFAGAFDFVFQVLGEEAAAAAVAAVPAPAAGGTRVDRDGPVLPPDLAAAAMAVPAPAAGSTRVDRDGAPLPPDLAAAAAPALAPEAPAAPAARFALQVEREGGADTFELPPGEHVVGRAAECAITIDDRTLSRRHARLVVAGDAVAIVDLESTNRTLVAGKPIFSDRATAVVPGTEIQFGGVRAILLRRRPGGAA
jgi:pSer/pThr/pTyr-binding forkhead associated (FHA) protein